VEDALHLYAIDGVFYTNLLGSWSQSPASDEKLAAFETLALDAPDQLLERLEGATPFGIGQHNGIPTKHYDLDAATIEATTPDHTPARASGDLGIAVDGNYLMHLDLTMSGTDLIVPTGSDRMVLTQGTLKVAADLSAVNEPIDTMPPKEALAPEALPDASTAQGLPADILAPPNIDSFESIPGEGYSYLASAPQMLRPTFFDPPCPKTGGWQPKSSRKTTRSGSSVRSTIGLSMWTVPMAKLLT
jgi:hypothetical protein